MDKREQHKKNEKLRLYKNIRNQNLSKNRYAKIIVSKIFKTYSDALRRQFKIEISRKNSKYIKIIKDVLINSGLNIDKISATVITITLNKCYQNQGYKYNHLCQAISNTIQKEIILKKLLEIPDAKNSIYIFNKDLKRQKKSDVIKQQLYKNYIKRLENEYAVHTTLDYETKSIISSYLLQILINSTGLIKIRKDTVVNKKSSLPKKVCYINSAYKNEINKILELYTDKFASTRTVDDYIGFEKVIKQYDMEKDYNEYILNSNLYFNIDKKETIKHKPKKYIDSINKANRVKYKINSQLLTYIQKIIYNDVNSRRILFDNEKHNKTYIDKEIFKSPTLKSYHNNDTKMKRIKELRYKIRKQRINYFSINRAISTKALIEKDIENLFYKLVDNRDKESASKLFIGADTLYDDLVEYDEYKRESKKYRKSISIEFEKIKHSRDKEIKNTQTLSFVNKYLSSLDYFTFDHKIDFRGRLYTASSTFSYQQEDLQRGLIQYKETAKIGNDTNFAYLIIQLCNHYGIKGNYDTMFKFFYNNLTSIINLFYYISLELPHSFNNINFDKEINSFDKAQSSDVYTIHNSTRDFVVECGDKIQFLSIAQHIAEIYRLSIQQNKPVKEIIKDYKIGNILYFDACNSAIQHSALLIRDKQLMKYTNLIYDNQDTIFDIYLELLNRFKDKVNSKIVNDLITRKDIKKFCMTIVYNSKKIAVKEEFFYMLLSKVLSSPSHYNNIKDKLYVFCNKITNSFIDMLFNDFSKKAFKGINDSKEYISSIYIQKKEKSGLFEEKNTFNFNLINYYTKDNYREIKYNLNTEKIRIYMKNKSDIFDKVKAKNAFNANYIHFKDAEHLMRVINNFDSDITTIHDCFGCKISDVLELNEVIREQLGNMYGIDIRKTPYSFY